MNEENKILLRRKKLVIVEPNNANYEQTKNEKALTIAIVQNVRSFGYTFSEKLFDKIRHMDKDELKDFHSNLISALKELVGADVEYELMYPNFPEQVMNADVAELFINSFAHYLSFGTLMPEYEKNERLPLIDDNKMTLLSVGSHEDLMDIFKNLAASKTSLSAQDKEDVKTIVKNCVDYMNYLPDEIPLKENVALISKYIIEESPIKHLSVIGKYFKTATDVLRLVTALSDGDISLAGKTKYRKLKRPERRLILDLLANCGDITEDLFRYRYEWIRIGEILHPFTYNYPQYRNVNRAFYVLRNKKKPLMFAGKVQNAIACKDTKTAADLLQSRPGEFARWLDKLLRDAADSEYILNCFKEVAEEVSTPVLLQVRQHFIGRMAETTNPVRVFFPKGNLANAASIKNELPAIDKTICRDVAKICRDALIRQYKNKEPLGKVYVDKEFKNYLIPFSQRSASSTSKSLVRGSQIPIKSDATAVRAFIWWTNTDNDDGWSDGRVDIDLSASVYNSDWRFVEHISYTRLRSIGLMACHSGDITDGGKPDGVGASEFIDINIDAVAKSGRYIVFQVYNYTGQKYSTLKNCRFGWMEREDVDSGEVFEPTTVNSVMDVSADSRVAIPVIFDCFERKFIWCDMNLSIDNDLYGGNNLENNLTGVTATCYAMTHLNKPNLYDLVMLNAMARGRVITDRNEADLIFSNDTAAPFEVVIKKNNAATGERRIVKEKEYIPIVTAFDLDYIVGELI